MALNIRNEEAESLAAALAKLTGESKTAAVTKALRERLMRVSREKRQRDRIAELTDIALRCARRPVLDPRSADEILGYDENGLPT
jgi:antitoxin VapB